MGEGREREKERGRDRDKETERELGGRENWVALTEWDEYDQNTLHQILKELTKYLNIIFPTTCTFYFNFIFS